jgi:hypothetical protein
MEDGVLWALWAFLYRHTVREGARGERKGRGECCSCLHFWLSAWFDGWDWGLLQQEGFIQLVCFFGGGGPTSNHLFSKAVG